MHVACVLRHPAKSPGGGRLDGPSTALSSVDAWERRERLRAWNDAVVRSSHAARAGGHQALIEISKLITMLQREIPEA